MSIEAVFRGFFNSGWAAVSAAYIAVIRFGKGPCDNGCSRCLTLIVLAVSGSSVHGASHAQKDQFMKKAESDMRAEYKRADFVKLERGKFFKEAANGTRADCASETGFLMSERPMR